MEKVVNIFILSDRLEDIPQYLVDKHINAQIKEGAQMLSTVFWVSGSGPQLYQDGLIYKQSHRNHPCNIWSRQSISNWIWLRDFVILTHKERLFRFPDRDLHKSFLLVKDIPTPKFLPNIGLTPFVKAIPDAFKHLDAVSAYRQYYINCKKHLFSWTNRSVPEWMLHEV